MINKKILSLLIAFIRSIAELLVLLFIFSIIGIILGLLITEYITYKSDQELKVKCESVKTEILNKEENYLKNQHFLDSGCLKFEKYNWKYSHK